MNTIIKKLFERTSTRKYIRNVNKKDIEIFINSDNKNKADNDKEKDKS